MKEKGDGIIQLSDCDSRHVFLRIVMVSTCSSQANLSVEVVHPAPGIKTAKFTKVGNSWLINQIILSLS